MSHDNRIQDDYREQEAHDYDTIIQELVSLLTRMLTIVLGAVCYSQTAGVVTAETVMGNFPYVPVSLANAETHPQNAHVRPVKSVV